MFLETQMAIHMGHSQRQWPNHTNESLVRNQLTTRRRVCTSGWRCILYSKQLANSMTTTSKRTVGVVKMSRKLTATDQPQGRAGPEMGPMRVSLSGRRPTWQGVPGPSVRRAPADTGKMTYSEHTWTTIHRSIVPARRTTNDFARTRTATCALWHGPWPARLMSAFISQSVSMCTQNTRTIRTTFVPIKDSVLYARTF